MRFRSIANVTLFGKLEIGDGNVRVEQKVSERGMPYLTVTFVGMEDFPVSLDASVDVIVKNNVLNEQTHHTVGSWETVLKAGGDLKPIRLARELHPGRTEIIVQFSDENGVILAETSGLRLSSDEDGDAGEGGGMSFIVFRRKEEQVFPIRGILEPEGPVIELGAYSPPLKACEKDFGIVAFGLPSAIRQIVTSLIADDAVLETPRWDMMRSAAAKWARCDDWKDVVDLSSQDRLGLNGAVDRVVEGFLKAGEVQKRLKDLAKDADFGNEEGECKDAA